MRINRLDLNQLLILDALLATRSVSRAAEQGHLSQPAVSATLAKFRSFFGDPLLVPHGKSLSLTPFAVSLMEPVRDLMLQAQALTRRRPEIEASRIERMVTMVGSDYVQNLLFAPLFRRAAQEAPGLSFEIRSISGSLNEELEQGDVDLVVSLKSGISDRHPSEILLRDGFVCLVWTGNDAVGKTLGREQFLRLGHVAVVLGRGRVPTLDQLAFDDQGLTRRVEVRVPSFSMVPACVVGTQRIGIVQAHLARSLVDKWPVRVLRCPIKITEVVTAVQWHRYQTLDPAISWVRAALHTVAKEVDQGPRV